MYHAVLILDFLEEKDGAGGPSDQCLIKHQVHIAQVAVCHLFVFDIRWVIKLMREPLALSVKCVDLSVFMRVKRLDRKVTDCGVAYAMNFDI